MERDKEVYLALQVHGHVEVDTTPPLLRRDQLIDWLIYHCPLFDSGDNKDPFLISYQGQAWRCDFSVEGDDPLRMYTEMADRIMQTSRRIHQEITDLYWYWTV